MMSSLRPLRPIALIAAAAALSACGTVSRIGNAINPFSGNTPHDRNAVPQEGRVSILATDQVLTADPALAGHAITVPGPVAMSDWSQPGGIASNAPPNQVGSATLEIAWRANLGAGSNAHTRIAAPPVIANGKLFFLDANQRVHAVDATNGHELWNQELRPRHSRDHFANGGGVAASGARVFVTTGYGFIVALDAGTGHEQWRVEGDAPFQSSPTVQGDRVLAITNDSELMALNAATGDLLWNYQAIAEPAQIMSAPSVAIDGETVIAPFASGEVVALLSANGRRLWSDSLSMSGRLTSLSSINDIAGRPVITNGMAFAASHSGILAAEDIRSGQRVWAKQFGSTQTPVVAGDVVYAVNVEGQLAAFDRATGGVYWVQQLRRTRNGHSDSGRVTWSGPVLIGGRLVLASSLGDVVAVSPESGQTVAHVDLKQPIFIQPIAANGQIYLVTDSAHLIVLR